MSDEDLARGLETLTHYPTISTPRRVYDELRGAGLLRDIEAPEATAAVSSYYESLAFIQGQIEFFRSSAYKVDLRYGRGQYNIYDPTRITRRRVEIKFGELAADPQYVNTIVGLLRNRLTFQIYRHNTMARASEMCVELAAATGEICKVFPAYEKIREMREWQMRDVPPREDED